MGSKTKFIIILLASMIVVVLGVGAILGINFLSKQDTTAREPLTICVGQTVALASGSSAGSMKWEAKTPGIINISEDGKITGLKEGTTKLVAIVDNQQYESEILVRAHVGSEATCTVHSTCIFCGTVLSPALGHDANEATCTEDSVCKRCNVVLSPALGHELQASTCENPSVCIRCGFKASEAAGHDMADATCNKPATCKRCGHTEGEALGHDASPATCTADSKCSRCGAFIAKATGHEPAAAVCGKDTLCKKCGAVVAKAVDHVWIDATCKAPATCKNCGETKGEKADHKYEEHGPIYDPQRDLMVADFRCIYCGVEFPSKPPYSKDDAAKGGAAVIDSTDVREDATAIFNAINAERKKLGYAELKYDNRLQAILDFRVREITDTYSHTRPNGNPYTELLTGNGYEFDASAEVFAVGYDAADKVMIAWMYTPADKAELLSTEYTHICVARLKAPKAYYRNYWVVFLMKE